MSIKSDKFDKFLEETEIKVFNKEAIENEMNSIVYRAHMEVSGQNLPAMVVIDDSIYTMIQVLVSQGTVKEANQAEVESYLNEMNKKYKVFKYYVGEGGNICLDSCITTTDEGFEPGIVHAIIDVILKHLTEEYPNLMRKVWGN